MCACVRTLVEMKFFLVLFINGLIISHLTCYMYCRPLRDDEVLPVRQHRIVPMANPADENAEETKAVSRG